MNEIVSGVYKSEFERSKLFSDDEKFSYCSSQVFEKHSFYINLSKNLSPAFPGVSFDIISEISEVSYFLLRALLAFDTIIDDRAISNLKLGLFNYEIALLRLNDLYPNHQLEFWSEFNEMKKRYFEVADLERSLSSGEDFMELSSFYFIAKGKSIFVTLIPLMLSFSSNSFENRKCLNDSLLHLHVGLQVLDDMNDFLIDIQKSQVTYANSSTRQYLHSLDINVELVSDKDLYKYFVASGLVIEHLTIAENEFRSALESVKHLPIKVYKTYVNQFGLEQVEEIRKKIKLLLKSGFNISSGEFK